MPKKRKYAKLSQNYFFKGQKLKEKTQYNAVPDDEDESAISIHAVKRPRDLVSIIFRRWFSDQNCQQT